MKYIYFLLLICFLAGCQQEQPDNQAEGTPDNTEMIQLSNADPSTQNPDGNQEKAQYLANLASSVPDVNDATALVTDRGVLVSIDVDKDLDRSHVGAVKYAVLEAIEHDPHGQRAVVVADADLSERLQGMANKIQEGQPLQAITEELANITGRWMPELPVKENQPDQKDQNKEMLDKQEQEELENIHEEQSNHHKD